MGNERGKRKTLNLFRRISDPKVNNIVVPELMFNFSRLDGLVPKVFLLQLFATRAADSYIRIPASSGCFVLRRSSL